MDGIKLGVVSQTPVVRFVKKVRGDDVRLGDLDEGDYSYTVGGVSPMVRSELGRLVKAGEVSRAVWFSLNPGAPRTIELTGRIHVVNISLDQEDSRQYTAFKQEVWNNVHNISSAGFGAEEYMGYFGYNSKLAKTMLQHSETADLFEIHDFQQLLLGAMLGPAFPTVFRWHIPFVPQVLNPKIRKFIINGMEGNDAIIVSTKRDLEGLIRAGFKGRAYQVYPHIDIKQFDKPTRSSMAQLCSQYAIKDDDFLVVNVARMDSIKSQDDLIRAIAMIDRKDVKLMLVGNGSFTSTNLGHSIGKSWRGRLEQLVDKLKLRGRVIFTGYLPSEMLKDVYGRADLFVLPSRTEGFGLVVAEAWLYDTPTIVSSGAGISELIIDDINGFVFRSGDYRELASRIRQVYRDSSLAESLGRNARRMAKSCSVESKIPALKNIYDSTISEFG